MNCSRTRGKKSDEHFDPLDPPRRVAGGEPVELQARIALPSDAACSFSAPANELRWLVNVRIARTGGPDWASDLPLMVQP